MRIFTFFFISLFWCSCNTALGQYYEVLETKKSYRENGEKLKKGERVDRHDIVTVKRKGELLLRSITYVNPRLKPGKYNIDSLMTFDYARHNTHDSLKNVLKSKKLLRCQFKYKMMVVPGSGKHYEVGRIEVAKKPIINLKKGRLEPSLVKWSNPNGKYQGSYVVIIQDAGSKSFLDVLETDTQKISIDFLSYNHPLIQYTIKALDCRSSHTYGVRVIP